MSLSYLLMLDCKRFISFDDFIAGLWYDRGKGQRFGAGGTGLNGTDTNVRFRLEKGGWLQAAVVGPRAFRIRMSATGSFAESPLIRYGILHEPADPGDCTIRSRSDAVELATGFAVLAIDRKDGGFALRNAAGDELTRTAEPPLPGGSGPFRLRLALADGERLYGFGDVTRERIEMRGQAARMWVTNATAYVPIPYAMCTGGWALLMNTSRDHTFDAGNAAPDRLSVEGSGGELDFYLFAGNGLGELLDAYTDAAGKPGLLPIWAYGLTFVCHETANSREVIEDALKFRRDGIPCDMIGLEGGWTERRYDFSTTKRWHPERFYMPASLAAGPHTFIGTLRSHGFKLSLLLFCDYDLSGREERLVRGDDSADGDVPEPWYGHLRKFVDQGVAAFKLSGSNQLKEHPQRQWGNGMDDGEMHNLYPVLLAKQMAAGFRDQTGRRPMLYTIAGYAGIQQFAGTWAGASHNGKEALVSMLNHGLSGHVHTTCDMFIHTKEGIHFGFLLPWSQINSWAYFRHPSLLDDRLRELFRTYAKLRYRLLPYLYSAAHVASRTGLPIMRAMPLMFPDDPLCRDMLHQYMLGDFLLVAAFTDRVYLPEGRWIDYWTGELHEGPKSFEYPVPDGAGGPLFVRAGAILPMWPEMDYVGQQPVERLALHVYPYGRSEFVLYEDDGTTLRYLEGQAAVTRMEADAAGNVVRIRIAARSGAYEGMPARRSYELYIHAAKMPSGITVNGELQREQPKRGKAEPTDGWGYDRLAGAARIRADERKEELCIEAVYPVGSGSQARKGTPKPKNAAAPPPNDIDKRLGEALQAGKESDAALAMRTWWTAGTDQSQSGDEWRTHLLDGCTTLIRLAVRQGWTAKAVFGDDYAVVFNLQSVPTKEEAFRLLERLVLALFRYPHATEPSFHPLVHRVADIVERELDRELTLHAIADRLHVHPSHLSRLFKKDLGKPFSEFVLKRRMERARSLLLSGMKVYEAAAMTGFKQTSYFSRVFHRYWGVPPVEFKG